LHKSCWASRSYRAYLAAPVVLYCSSDLNSNFKNKKFYLCRLSDDLAGGKRDDDGRRLAPATFATSFSLPAIDKGRLCRLLGVADSSGN